MFVERRRISNLPFSGPLMCSPTGDLYAVSGIGKVTKIESSDTMTEYTDSFTVSDGVGGRLVWGPDGNIWGTAANDNQIVKMTPSGVFTHYNVPTAAASPGVPVVGPDSNLWFTEGGANKIAKITTSGTITEYSVAAGHTPIGMLNGNDGKLWVTTMDGSVASHLKSYNTSGVEQSTAQTATHPVGAAGTSLALSSDDIIWVQSFLGLGNHKISRVDKSGTLLSTDPPLFTSILGGITELIPYEDRFLIGGQLFTDLGNVAWDIAVIANDNTLLALERIQPEVLGRTVSYGCQDRTTGLFYFFENDGGVASIIGIEDTGFPRLLDGDKLTERRR